MNYFLLNRKKKESCQLILKSMARFGITCFIMCILQFVLAQSFVLAINHSKSFRVGVSSVQCIHLGGAPYMIYSEFLSGDRVLAADSLSRFNNLLHLNRGDDDNTDLKLCVHVLSSKYDIPDVVSGTYSPRNFQVFSDKSSLIDTPETNFERPLATLTHVRPERKNSWSLTNPDHSKSRQKNVLLIDKRAVSEQSMLHTHISKINTPESAYYQPSDISSQSTIAISSTTTIYVNSLVDSVANISACADSTSPPVSLNGSCNIRSAFEYCTFTWNHSTSDECIVNFPFAETMYFDPSLGELTLGGESGYLILEGNNCTVTVAAGEPRSARFLDARVSNKLIAILHLLIRNIIFDSFGSDLFDGGVLRASGLASLTIDHVTFLNNKADNGGSIFLEHFNSNVEISYCNFIDSNVRSNGGAIVVQDNTELSITNSIFMNTNAMVGGAIYIFRFNNNMKIMNCSFIDTYALVEGGAVFISENNANMVISGCSFENLNASYEGGAIFMYQENENMIITDCSFVNTTARNGGAVMVFEDNTNLTITLCSFHETSAGKSGGALYIFRDNYAAVVSNCAFIDTRAQYGASIYINQENYKSTISNCSFLRTFSSEESGAIYVGVGNEFSLIVFCSFQYSFGKAVCTYGNYQLHIKDSVFSNCYSSNGAAVYAFASNFYLEVRNCSFSNCVATEQGGAVRIGYENDYMKLIDLTFTDCSAADGGALYIASENDFMIAANISFINSSAFGDGGAMLIRDTNRVASLVNLRFFSNTAGSFGGALAITSSNLDVTLENCIFKSNMAKLGGTCIQSYQTEINLCFAVGGAVHSTLANSGIKIKDCMFESNSGPYGGSLYFGTDHSGILVSGVVVTASQADYGAAIYFDQFNTDASLMGSTLKGNAAKEQGGAVFSLATDLFMRDCDILSNDATSGAGVYHPSALVEARVNISSCLFEDNSAIEQFGSVYVELASTVTILASNFTRNTASLGGALGVKESSIVDIKDCSFVRNVVNESAGAVYLESEDMITITGCLFERNRADAGSGAAVWLSAGTSVKIEDNKFVRNTAINGGGAVHWLVSSGMVVPVGLESTQSVSQVGNYYNDNRALYGDNVSSDAFALAMSQDDVYEVKNYDSYIPPVVIYLVDYYNQIVRVDSSGVAVAAVLIPSSCYGKATGFVTDGFIKQAKVGVFNFSTLSAYCDPGYSMTVNVTSGNANVESVYFKLSFRSCVRGEYYQDSVCIPCDYGTFSLTDPTNLELSELSNIDVCKHCPSGAQWCANDTIQLKKGYWRINDNSSTLQLCPYGEHACNGGTGSGNSLCHKGYIGPLCAVCDDGYAFHSVSKKCEQCSASSIGASTILALLTLVILVVGLGYIVHTQKIKNSTDMIMYIFTKLRLLDPNDIDKEQQAGLIAIRFRSVFKIYVTLWQVVSIMPFALDLTFPDAYSVIIVVLNTVNVDISRSSLVSCSGGHSYDFIDSLVVDTIGPIVVVFLLWLMHLLHLNLKSNRSKASARALKGNYYKAFLLFTYLILPSVSAKIFQVFSVNDVDPGNDQSGEDVYMAVDYSVSCSSKKYRFGYAWAIASVVVYPVGIPAYYFYALYTSRVIVPSQSVDRTVSVEFPRQHIQYSVHHPEYWYWEVVETIKRLMLTGVLVLIAQGSAVQIVVGICFSVFFIELYRICSPFVDHTVARLEAVAQRQILCIFFLALLIKSDFESIRHDALDAFLIIALFSNIFFLLREILMLQQSVKGRSASRSAERQSEMSPFSNFDTKHLRWDDEEVVNSKVLTSSVVNDENNKESAVSSSHLAMVTTEGEITDQKL